MKAALALGICALVISPLSAYYHYVHYNAAGVAINEKFDLTAIPNQTVTYFVTTSGPTIYPQNDSFSSVLSQVNQAISTWNAVGTSSVRLAFGGLYNPSTPLPATPGGRVEFSQLPPGYYGMTSVTTSTAISPSAQFVPILYSTVYLTTDLATAPGPSYSSAFFLTTVHEIGHSLGLQHTYTSSAMSTAATRATSLTTPIHADDIAGLSVLYPTSTFSSSTGTITGRVTANGAGVHMASVVAIHQGSDAVSTLTNPDGTFEIDGVPAGNYVIYAHPLPPGITSSCLNICAPLDVNGNAVPPSGPFDTTFYGSGTGSIPATQTAVAAGQVTPGINIAVTPRSNVPVYDITMFTFYGTNVVSPGYLNIASSQGYGGVLAAGTGVTASGKVVNGLTAQIMGGAASIYAVAAYTDPNNNTYLNIGVEYSLGGTAGPQHLIFTLGDYTYVLPSALNLVTSGAPTVSGISPNGDGSVTINGTNFASSSLIYFDGLPATIRSLNPQTGQAVVIPPPGASGQQSTVIVYNYDGQNSLFVQASSPVTYPYPAAPAPTFTLTPASLPAGSEALVTINGTNTSFTSGQTVVGFGSSDVYVRSVIVQSPTQLLADVSIPTGAVNTSLEASVIAGFQIAAQPNAFQIVAPVTALPAVIPSLQNATAGLTGAYPGATVTFTGTNLEAGSANPSVTINGNPVAILSATANSVTMQLPSNLSTGAAILALNNGATNSFPVAVNIAPPPATITSIQNAGGSAITAVNPISGGNVVNLYLSGFASSSTAINGSQVTINVGGVNHTAVLVQPVAGGLFEVTFVLSNLVPAGSQTPIVVYLNGNSSYASTIATSND
jgi:uncharacterized protein (TIGR03437 family)